MAKEKFFDHLRSIAAMSASTSVAGADVARRSAPAPVFATADAVLAGAPPAPPDCAARWVDFCARHARAWAPPLDPTTLDEIRDVHPSIGAALGAAAAARGLRVWRDAIASDAVPVAEAKPDFSVAHERDAALSLMGALLLVEVKLPGNLRGAEHAAAAVLRRRVYALCCEADARGEPCGGISALGAGTDGQHVVLVRVHSGAPPAGVPFSRAHVPCPTLVSEPLPLLDGWDFRAPPPDWAARAPPAGFVALARALAEPRQLCGGCGPITALRAAVRWEPCAGDAAAPAEQPGSAVDADLALGARIGSGGASDVYACGAPGDDAFAKVARSETTAVVASFAAERAALGALRDAARDGLVPELLGAGVRVAAPDAARGSHSAGAWPLIVARPRGTPLAEWLEARAAAAAAAAGAARGGSAAMAAAAAAARRADASAVVLRIFDALDAAHAAGIIHCDVRPSNVVIARDGRALLIDFGLSRAPGADAHSVGVAAYADARVFWQGSFVARRAQDAAGALYTWLSAAFGAGGVAPWLATRHARSDIEMLDDRDEWLVELAARDAGVARVAAALREASNDSARSATGAAAVFARARAAVAAAREGPA